MLTSVEYKTELPKLSRRGVCVLSCLLLFPPKRPIKMLIKVKARRSYQCFNLTITEIRALIDTHWQRGAIVMVAQGYSYAQLNQPFG